MRYLLFMVLFGLALLPLPANSQGTVSPTKPDPLAEALEKSDVFIGKTLRSTLNPAPLLDLTKVRKGTDRPLKIAIVTALPDSGKQFGTRETYTRELHRYLRLDRGTLIIVTSAGISASTNALSSDRISAVVKQNASPIKSNRVKGVVQLVAALDTEAAQTDSDSGIPTSRSPVPPQPPAPAQSGGDLSPLLFILPLGLALAFVAWLITQSGANRRKMMEAQIPVQRLHGEVVEGISYADTYLDLLPPSSELTAAVQQRQAAAQLLEQAKGFARAARTPLDYGRAQALLEQAKASTFACRQYIDTATGGTRFAIALEGTDYRVTPALGVAQAAPVIAGWRSEDIPSHERGACFFCSRPEWISRMTPLTVALSGQRRKVLSCSDCVRIVQNGAMPQVRTVQSNGQSVPWYNARSYDPYRDYTHSEAYYVDPYYGYVPYDNGFTAGFLFGTMLSEPSPMAYPVFVAPSGDLTNDFQAATETPASVDFGGSSDFFGSNDTFSTSGSDAGGMIGTGDSVGSADFGNGSSDWSSSGDSTDYGSSSSSSDSGGSDFGGGGDSGGGGGGGDY